ncbi:30S ribosomal protein S16 [Texas Phoenix palm phytoplasma]|uniref:Small ribosomal subunit protein bS16 n=1 Tax=Texas Phoenix palm phytoplasma TaxID=176709 RepID=A0ABS5BIG2_9MOLU|nr:30S ribosomal protein S16 [Texas Phoenix palm phytoplasma]MBP3059373.1 30S ribosomal protein S16 [Texas Phoenix palm phytoplasma]
MSVKMRLQLLGCHKRPFYRVTVMDSHNKRNGKFLDILGTYEPFNNKINIDCDRADKWLLLGAQPTDIVKNLLKKAKKLKNQN